MSSSRAGGASTPEPDPALLTIGQVAQRTGLSVALIRSWEQRYGVPRPERSASGQRRYRESDCALLAEVLRRRDAGQSLGSALAQAGSFAVRSEASIFAELRRRHPDLTTHVMEKRLLGALTSAIEDECCARAQRPLLLGCFQRQRFYRAAAGRWLDLASTAEQTIALADFDASGLRPGPIFEIALGADSPLRREWALVCDAGDLPACVVGRERLGQTLANDKDRIFEVVWSADPLVVRDALRSGVAAAELAVPGLADRIGARLDQSVARASTDLTRATGLLGRTLDYLADVARA